MTFYFKADPKASPRQPIDSYIDGKLQDRQCWADLGLHPKRPMNLDNAIIAPNRLDNPWTDKRKSIFTANAGNRYLELWL